MLADQMRLAAKGCTARRAADDEVLIVLLGGDAAFSATLEQSSNDRALRERQKTSAMARAVLGDLG